VFLFFLSRYVYRVVKLIITPLPFPFAQLTTHLLVAYLVTLPFAVLSKDGTTCVDLLWDCLVVFIVSYGFLGLEFVARAMDDPFKDKMNGFE